MWCVCAVPSRLGDDSPACDEMCFLLCRQSGRQASDFTFVVAVKAVVYFAEAVVALVAVAAYDVTAAFAANWKLEREKNHVTCGRMKDGRVSWRPRHQWLGVHLPVAVAVAEVTEDLGLEVLLM